MKNIIRWVSLWFSAPGAGDTDAEILAEAIAKGTMR